MLLDTALFWYVLTGPSLSFNRAILFCFSFCVPMLTCNPMFRPRCFNCLLCKCAAGSLTSAGLTQRLTTAAVGAAEWRTVLVRGGDRTSSRRAVTISVQLGNGPSSEPGRTLDARNRRLPATLNCLDEACFPPNHSSNFAHLVWLVLSWLGAVHFSIHAKSVYPFIARSGLASGLPSAPAGVIMLQLALVSPSPIAPLEEPLLTSQQRMEAARDSQVGMKQRGGCTSMLFIHKDPGYASMTGIQFAMSSLDRS